MLLIPAPTPAPLPLQGAATPTWVWWLVGGGVATATALAVLVVVRQQRQQQPQAKALAGGPTAKSGRAHLEQSLNVDEAGAKFLSLMPPEKRARAERALAVILPAYVQGEIFNVDYQDAKDTLNRLIDAAYEERIQKPFLWGKGYTPIYEIDSKIGSVSGLHQVISVAKKVAKLQPPGAYGDAQRAFAEAALPLALIVADLKAKVVKGRKPDPEAAARRAAVEARKNVQTCSVCFRGIAVLSNGRIADHGYTLPHRWHKTASCPGGMFRPLEVASDGLAFMVQQLTRQAAEIPKRIKEAKQATSLIEAYGPSWDRKQRTITPADPSWRMVLQQRVGALEGELRETQSALADYQRRLAAWQPGPQATL